MDTGRILLLLGLVLVSLGLVWMYAPGLLSWFGRLPGDIRMEREGFRFFFPLTSMLLVSLALSLLLYLLRFFRGP
ncbi:DUF2905 domain-containing protein [uncultured Meiothermus sp.]|jgi:hypothetical protein|uniref:DUF2905 domain-containing protein n=1 Tax=uncultured Meiothermus sp. TaxID=157471 RepID=UPI00260A5D3E|nr:DUF2905 domain-containing protein [uncultured Meiothermus sp.]